MGLGTGLCCALLLVTMLPLSANASSKVRCFLLFNHNTSTLYIISALNRVVLILFLAAFYIKISALHSVYGG
jgi:hypothetical protein